MIKSMTGFGRGMADVEGIKVNVDVRTVNNRYLDAHIRLPQEYSQLELTAKKQIQRSIKRGRLDAVFSIERSGSVAFSINRDAVRAYLNAVSVLKEEFGLGGELTLDTVVRLPGTLQSTTEVSGEDGEIERAVTAALAVALDGLVAMREAEGAALASEIDARLNTIETLLPAVESRAGEVPAQYRERLEKRIEEMAPGKPIDEGRLAQEVAYLADRGDISEEIARLKSHLAQFKAAVHGDDIEVGKRLDFLLQEMNREANTILSKSANVEISEAAIGIKAEVEKLREQVQNVE